MLIGPRIKALRNGLGLTQEALASDLGVDQSYVAKWESNKRPVANPSVFYGLLHHLKRPRSRPFGQRERMASRRSPLEQLPCVSSDSRKVLDQLFSAEVTDESWLRSFKRQLWPSSKRPYETSAILEDVSIYYGLLPDQEVIDHDIRVHGKDYVRNLAKYWNDLETFEERDWASVRKRSYFQGLELLEACFGFRSVSRGREPLDFCDLESNLDLILPKEWKSNEGEQNGQGLGWKTEAFAFGLDMLSLVCGLVNDPDPKTVFERVQAISEPLESWRVERSNSDSRQALAKLDVAARVALMECAIADFNKRTKRRRGRPRKEKVVKYGA